jgi:eukaryotic-like serine/threonine-protein kinase
VNILNLSGQRIDDYQLYELCGLGGMSAVYRASHVHTGAIVAVKLLRFEIADEPTNHQRFQREAQLIQQLQHPRIVPLYDVNLYHQPPYLAMAFIDGLPLKAIMQQGQLPVGEMLYLLQQIASALDYAHQQGIVHRDIKPGNLLVNRQGEVFLADLGLARLMTVDMPEQITKAGTVLGTPDYMSPEQALADPKLNHAADIYSLGVVVFELLTGQLPYQASTASQVISRRILAPIPSANALNPNLPPAIDSVIQKALAKEPSKRYERAGALIEALVTALDTPPAIHPTWIYRVMETH